MKKDRPHILFISRWYPDRHDPMPGLFVRRHAEAVSRFADVTVLYVTPDATIPEGSRETVISESDGIKEVRVYFGKSNSSLWNGMQMVKCYLKALKEINNPDLTHIHVLSRTAIPAIWLKWTKGVPYVITEHWSRYLPENVSKGSFRGWLRRWFTRWVVQNAKGVSTVTKNLAKAMQELGLRNPHYVITPNVADTETFKPSPNTREGSTVRFVHVSCFDEPAKNIRGIIDAFVVLASSHPDVSLSVVGDGPDFKEVYEHAQKTGLIGSKIGFTGLLEGPALLEQMQSADAMVMFSNYENLPCTIVESICCGVPVISSDVGGIREHVN
ncbi:MAG: glycosyltransferase, partial [Bacteroidota bacterium]